MNILNVVLFSSWYEKYNKSTAPSVASLPSHSFLVLVIHRSFRWVSKRPKISCNMAGFRVKYYRKNRRVECNFGFWLARLSCMVLRNIWIMIFWEYQLLRPTNIHNIKPEIIFHMSSKFTPKSFIIHPENPQTTILYFFGVFQFCWGARYYSSLLNQFFLVRV